MTYEEWENMEDKTLLVDFIDKVVSQFRKSKDGKERYICDEMCAWPTGQFNPKDFRVYKGKCKVGERVPDEEITQYFDLEKEQERFENELLEMRMNPMY